MKKFAAIVLVVAVGYALTRFGGTLDEAPPSAPAPTSSGSAERAIAAAFTGADVGRIVEGSGTVTRILADDNDGSRHQRFILRLASGQTVLVAHNIDLAPRVAELRVGDSVEFKGEYVDNPQGGVIHWTHRDPKGRHGDGWLRHRDHDYR
ncbi:MAG: DUF3465 domain-containing protein [Steroidobacteraceae bacterium]